MTMRFPLAIAACLAFALVVGDGASAQNASGTESSSRLLVLNRDGAAQPNGGLRILRGATAAPRVAAATPQADALLGPGRWQVVAGERFWVFDQETGKLASCRNRATANVGERELECTFGTVSRYRRTFGNNFRH
jgi:hypothetical protein